MADEGSRMRMRWASASTAGLLWLALASCTIAGQAVIRNDTSSDILLWPLSERPVTLKAGEATAPIVYTARERQQAMIERGGCLYTYPAPDYFQLPKGTKRYASRIVVVIEEDMILHAFQRSKRGVEGPEILAAGFPLRPETYCGRRGEG
jgi:hypothetical protein